MASGIESNIQNEEFSQVLQRAYAAYGLSVVTDRALPDARDGLKPVQRRILYGMLVRRFLASRPTVKSAEIVGSILGDYHPHGDSSVYDAMVRMAQDFTMRYPLIDGQGNFGSLDGDPAAAYRYTEARLSPFAESLMQDIEKETVSLHPTYKQDSKVLEPDYLPGRLPPVVNPSSGIAVGLSTNILPHNLNEVMKAAIALLDKPEMTTEELMTYITGPDFASGGRVIGGEGIRDYLTTGKGRIIVRGEVRLEENPRTRQRALVVASIPPIGRDKVKASIVKAINDRKLEGVVPEGYRDETDTEKGTRIVLELRKDADPRQVLQALYTVTDLQIAITTQMVFLFGEAMAAAREPKQVGMVFLLNHWNRHQLDIVRRRTAYDLSKAKDRLHIVEGLITGSANARQIVAIFQEAENRDEAKAKIRANYQLSERQVEVIADMTLSQVTRLDAGKYATEKAELESRIASLQELLDNPRSLTNLLKREMNDLVKRYGDSRRTLIDLAGNPLEVAELTAVADSKQLVITVYKDGTAQAIPPEVFFKTSRSKASSEGLLQNLPKGEELLLQAPLVASSGDYLLFFSANGRVFGAPASELPMVAKGGKGKPLSELLQLAKGEKIVAVLAVADFDEGGTVLEISASGKIKKAPATEYRVVDEKGAASFKLTEGDQVVSVVYLPPLAEGTPPGDYLLTTNKGFTLRFSEEEVRTQQGRVSQGVQGINLAEQAKVVKAFYLPANTANKYLLFVTAQGLAKKVALEQYPPKGRATNGVLTLGLINGGDSLVSAVVVDNESEVALLTVKSGGFSCKVSSLPSAVLRAPAQSLLTIEKPGDSLRSAFVMPASSDV